MLKMPRGLPRGSLLSRPARSLSMGSVVPVIVVASSTSRWAVAFPMPLDPPVIRPIFPSKCLHLHAMCDSSPAWQRTFTRGSCGLRREILSRSGSIEGKSSVSGTRVYGE